MGSQRKGLKIIKKKTTTFAHHAHRGLIVHQNLQYNLSTHTLCMHAY